MDRLIYVSKAYIPNLSLLASLEPLEKVPGGGWWVVVETYFSDQPRSLVQADQYYSEVYWYYKIRRGIGECLRSFSNVVSFKQNKPEIPRKTKQSTKTKMDQIWNAVLRL